MTIFFVLERSLALGFVMFRLKNKVDQYKC